MTIHETGANHPLVMFSALDWGLGHASRLIPVIRQYKKSGCRIIIGGSGRSLLLLRTAFPDETFIHIPSFTMKYSGGGIFPSFEMIARFPGMIWSVIREHRAMKSIAKIYHIDQIVSDNRYGLFCSGIYSILLTHQISPVLPFWLRWAEYPVYLGVRWLIHHFDECWIPDNAEFPNFSGKLSHRFSLPAHARFIGILSRFTAENRGAHDPDTEKYDLVTILSGPQPQLRRFTKLLIDQVIQLPVKTLIIAGLQDIDEYKNKLNDRITVVAHLSPDAFQHIILNARLIVCRSGYSTIMDLVALEKSAVIVPTPGQTEQEYLARYLSERGLFDFVEQSDLDLRSLTEALN